MVRSKNGFASAEREARNMELDEDTKQKIEARIGKKISETDRVDGLLNVPEPAARAAMQLYSCHGYSILAILYLRYLSGCGLKEAVDFLGRTDVSYLL